MGRVAGMCVADDSFDAHPVQRLQVFDQLFEDGEASRAIHLADVRRHHNPLLPGKRDCAFHLPSDRKCRARLLPWQIEFEWRRTAAQAQGSWLPGNIAKHRVIGWSYDAPVMMQEAIDQRRKMLLRLFVVSEYGFAANISGRCYKRLTYCIQQQLVQRAVRQEDADILKSWSDVRRQRGAAIIAQQDDRSHGSGDQAGINITDLRVATNLVASVGAAYRKHDGQRLVWPLFAISQPGDGGRIERIAYEVIAADTFHGDRFARL